MGRGAFGEVSCGNKLSVRPGIFYSAQQKKREVRKSKSGLPYLLNFKSNIKLCSILYVYPQGKCFFLVIFIVLLLSQEESSVCIEPLKFKISPKSHS